MKNLKTVIVLLTAATLFAACVHTPSGSRDAPFPILGRIQDRGELVVGTAGSMPPLNFTSKDGQVMGFEVDLAKHMARAMGVELRLETMAFSELLPALEANRVDMVLSGMTITPERNLKVAFVGPYFVSGKAILTKRETLAAARDPSDMDRPNIILTALRGSTSQYFVEEFMPRTRLAPARNYDEAVSMVIDGRADALIADFPICVVSVLRYPDKGLVSLITPLTYEPIGIALPPNDPLLINWVANFMGALEGAGRMEELKREWFENAAWLRKLP